MSALLRSIAKTVSIASIAAVACSGAANADPPKKGPATAAPAPAARPAAPPHPAPAARPAPPASRAAAPAPHPSVARPAAPAPHFSRPAAPAPHFSRPAAPPPHLARPDVTRPGVSAPRAGRPHAPSVARPNVVRSHAPNVARSHSRPSFNQPSASIRQVPNAASRANTIDNAKTNVAGPNAKTTTSNLSRPVFRTRREAREAARAQARATREQTRAARTQQRIENRVQARIQDRINARLARQNRLNAQTSGTTGTISRNARTRSAAAAIGTSFAGRHAAHAGWYRDWRRHRRAHGWYGPLYWPYAYDSLFANVFIPYDDYGEYAYDPFWDYGYGDIYAGMFSPYDYDDLLTTQAPAGERRYASAPPQGAGETTAAIQQLAPMCGDDSKDVAGVPVDEIQNAVNPDEKQLAALDELGNASVKAAQIVKASCPADIALTAPARIDAMKQRIDAMIEAVATVRQPLEHFYGMLSDEQKARFNAIGQREEDRRASKSSRGGEDNGLARSCGMTGATTWPQAQIERSVKPTAAQQKALDALHDAADKAAEQLKASCPSDVPATPVERLAAIDARLHAMHDAIATVQAPLKEFYASLTDAQKAQFNAVGRSRTRQG